MEKHQEIVAKLGNIQKAMDTISAHIKGLEIIINGLGIAVNGLNISINGLKLKMGEKK
jgi:hypothetical protein